MLTTGNPPIESASLAMGAFLTSQWSEVTYK